jgi:PAS domain S-box-containing protein
MKCRRCRKDRSARFCEDCGARLEVTELEEAEPRVSWVLEHVSDIVSVVGQDGIIQYESPAVERLLGWRPEELLGRHVLDYVHPDDVARLSAAIARRIADPAPVNPPTEFRVRARDGSWHVLAAMSRVSQDEAGAVSLVVTSRDVTEQRALEDRLRYALRMESIAHLSTAAAHEINNPLAVLLAHLAIWDREAPPSPRIGKMIEAAKRIQDIVERMSRITRVEMVRRASPALPEMLDIWKSSEAGEAPRTGEAGR